VIADVCAAQGERLLALIDGERRLTNYLQLGELLQEASAQALGMHGLLDWLQGQMASADQDDEQQLLRLESDARRVQIITLHKSKGLEYPLVFLPFVGIDGGAPNTASHCTCTWMASASCTGSWTRTRPGKRPARSVSASSAPRMRACCMSA
jgi:exodeoxyribonuclease V beta subunit